VNLARSCVIIPEGEREGEGRGGEGERVSEEEVDASLFVPNLFLCWQKSEAVFFFVFLMSLKTIAMVIRLAINSCYCRW